MSVVLGKGMVSRGERGMRVVRYIALVTVLCLVLPGCSPSHDNEEYITPDEQAKIWADQVIECFVNRDADALKNLFCENMQNQYVLEEQIQELFAFIDEEIVSYDEPRGSVSGGVSTEVDGIVEKAVWGEIRNVVTEDGVVYQITLSGYVIYKEDENNIGLDYLSVRNVDLFNYYKSENPRFYIEDTPEVNLVEKRISKE